MVMVVFAAILNTSDDAYVGKYEIIIPRICIFCGIQVNTLRTGLLNCSNARSRGLIQSEVRFL